VGVPWQLYFGWGYVGGTDIHPAGNVMFIDAA
jgi:hypothetical protein